MGFFTFFHNKPVQSDNKNCQSLNRIGKSLFSCHTLITRYCLPQISTGPGFPKSLHFPLVNCGALSPGRKALWLGTWAPGGGFCWCLLSTASISWFLRLCSTGQIEVAKLFAIAGYLQEAPGLYSQNTHLKDCCWPPFLRKLSSSGLIPWRSIITRWRETKRHSFFCLNHFQRAYCDF